MSRSGGQEQKTNPEESTWVKGRKMSSSQGFTEERKEKGMGGETAGTGIAIITIIIQDKTLLYNPYNNAINELFQ